MVTYDNLQHIYIYICMNVCMHACMHVCMYVCVLIYIYIWQSMDQWNHNAVDFASSVLQHGLVHVFVDGMAALNELDRTLFFILQTWTGLK